MLFALLFILILFIIIFYNYISKNKSKICSHFNVSKNKKIEKLLEEDNITISICIPCVPKHVPLLRELLKNIDLQTKKPHEIIVALCQTNSIQANKLEKELNKVHDFPIKIIFTEGRASAATNRNKAAKCAQGELISFIDADDLMHVQRLEIIAYIYKEYHCKSILHNYLKEENTKIFSKEDILKNIKHGKEIYKIHKKFTKAPNISIDITNGHITCHRSIFQVLEQPMGKEFLGKEDAIFVRMILDHYGNKDDTMCITDLPLSIYRSRYSAKYRL